MYKFPTITHMKQIEDAIAGREEFIKKVDAEHGIVIFNYLVNFEDTFPPVTDERSALLRECRGITFDAIHGHVISRKFPKFFNLNEKVETRPENMDFTQPHVILEKLDGSMITPLAIHGEVRFCTKMGLTDVAIPVDAYARKHANLIEFCKFVLAAGMTPIFEWCSRSQRIVVDYPVDRLVLTAIRDNVDGEVMAYDAMVAIATEYSIEVVKQLPGTAENIQKFMDEVHDLEGEEGYIIRFDTGYMVKVKGEWYLGLHKALDNLRWEKDVIQFICQDKLDDVKAFLPADLVEKADNFSKQMHTAVNDVTDRMWWIAQAAYDNFNGSKKRFALEVVPQNKDYQNVLFKAWDLIDSEATQDDLKKFVWGLVLSGTSSGAKVETIRHLIGGIHWDPIGTTEDAE